MPTNLWSVDSDGDEVLLDTYLEASDAECDLLALQALGSERTFYVQEVSLRTSPRGVRPHFLLSALSPGEDSPMIYDYQVETLRPLNLGFLRCDDDKPDVVLSVTRPRTGGVVVEGPGRDEVIRVFLENVTVRTYPV